MCPINRRLTRLDGLSLALVLLVAALLRLGNPGVVEFLHDEAMLSLMAQDMVAGEGIPLTGIPSSVGVPNPPISVYIMALPYTLGADPQAATLFVAALNVLGVGLLWLIAYRYLGRLTALIAGMVYAINPWALLYSRKIWAQDFHTPLVLLALGLGLYGFGENKRWAQVLCLPVLILALQIHFAAWALLPLYLYLLWLGRKNLSWRVLILSFALAGITLIPFLLGLSQTLQADPNRISNALNREHAPLALTTDALVSNLRFATGLGLETVVAPEQTADLPAQVPPSLPGAGILGLAAVIGFIAIWATSRLRAFAPLLTLWFGVPLAVFSLTWTPTYPHYFIASLPVLALLTGIGIAALIDRVPQRWLKGIVALAVGVALLTQGFWWRDLLHYLDTTVTPNGFGTPIHYLNAVRDAIAQNSDVLIISNGFEILYDQEPAIWSAMLRDKRCVRTIAGDGVAVFPAGDFAAVIAPNAPENSVNNLYHTPDEQVFPLRSDEGAYRINHFVSAPEWNGPPLTTIIPARFASEIQLTGYALEADRLMVEWRLPGPVDADYHYFAHFLNANGDKLGQRDNVLWPGRYWCAGDRLLTWTAIDKLPPEVTTLRVGLYTLDKGGFVNAPMLDAAGNFAGTWVDIPLTEP